MKDGKRTLLERIRSIKQDIERDKHLFLRYGFDSSLIELYVDNTALDAFRILFAYALLIIQREDKHKYAALQKYFAGYAFESIKIDENLEDTLIDIQMDMMDYNIHILDALSLFGWKVAQFENDMIRMGDIELSQFNTKEVRDFIVPYIEAVYNDSLENDGEMSLFVLENERIGKYKLFMKAYPKKVIPILHNAIEEAHVFLNVPMYYWEGDLHGNFISQEGVFYTIFAQGYYGNMERYSDAHLISPGCQPMACYMNHLLQIAEEKIPAFREFMNH